MINSSNVIRMLMLYFITTIVQIVILNNLTIINFANPQLYLLFLLSMPFGVGTIPMMLYGFITGIVIDLFCDTPGMHAASCVLLAYVRRWVLMLLAYRDAYKPDDIPTFRLYGWGWYLKYITILVTIHHIALFFIEQYDMLFLWPTLLRILLSIVTTVLVISIVQYILPFHNESGGTA